MANLSIREAVKHFDVSRPTLANALKSGKVAGVKDGQGAWSIDPSEMARVYRARTMPTTTLVDNSGKEKLSTQDELSTFDSPIAGQIEALQESLAKAERRAAESEQRAAVAEALAEERRRILDETLKLIPPPTTITTPASEAIPPRRRWWHWHR